jgi:hypothetical protein
MDHESFYATTAQVIPVLWIVLVFQIRFFGTQTEEKGASDVEPNEVHRSTGTMTLVMIVFVGIVMWLAEALAIAALQSESDSSLSRLVIQLAIVSGGFLVFYIPVFPWFEALIERTPAEKGRHWVWRKLGVGPYSRKAKRSEDAMPDKVNDDR